jgi:hypothetical protein
VEKAQHDEKFSPIKIPFGHLFKVNIEIEVCFIIFFHLACCDVDRKRSTVRLLNAPKDVAKIRKSRRKFL